MSGPNPTSSPAEEPSNMTEKPPETTPETATARATAAAPNTNHHESTSVKENEVKPEDSQHDHDAEPVYATGFKLFTIMTAITLPCFLMLLDTSIIVTAIPVITNRFNSLPDVGWYGSAYLIASAVLQPLTGKIYMSFNSKWTFMGFFALFELGSLLCGVAVSSTMLIVGRAVAGMGTSGILNGAFTIIAGCSPMVKRPTLIGLLSGISQLGIVLGPLIGGALTEHSTWRWCFYLNLPIGGAVFVVLALIHIPEQIEKPPWKTVIRTLPAQLDLVGFAIFAPAAIMLLLALEYGGIIYPWNSRYVIGLFCGAGATFLLWLAWDYRKGDAAMIPLSMAKKRVVWSGSLTYGFFLAQMFTVSYYLPIYFQAINGASPTLSGVYMLPLMAPHVAFSFLSGVLVGKVGYFLPFGLVGGALAAVSNGLFSTMGVGTSTGQWVGYQIIGGAARGIALQVPIIAVQNSLPPPQIPIAMALLMFSQALGGSLFLSFASTIFTNSLKTLIPQYAPSVDPQQIIDVGATGFRGIIRNPQELDGVLAGYARSVDRVHYLTAAAAVASFFTCCFVGLKDIRKRNQPSKV
ncbi:MFS general substrate transporter [Apiospora arundinis]